MAKSYTDWAKLFLGFGIVTIISGIYLILQKDYVIGISGSFVGVLLVIQNMMKTKDNNSE